MIVSYNVCDYCGNQNIINQEGFSGLRINLEFASIADCVNRDLVFVKKERHEMTFCDKDCFIEYIKSKFNKHGHLIEGEEDE